MEDQIIYGHCVHGNNLATCPICRGKDKSHKDCSVKKTRVMQKKYMVVKTRQKYPSLLFASPQADEKPTEREFKKGLKNPTKYSYFTCWHEIARDYATPESAYDFLIKRPEEEKCIIIEYYE
jgi:hypothetical protein